MSHISAVTLDGAFGGNQLLYTARCQIMEHFVLCGVISSGEESSPLHLLLVGWKPCRSSMLTPLLVLVVKASLHAIEAAMSSLQTASPALAVSHVLCLAMLLI